LFSNKFGIEIEFTGITRQKAADVAAEYFGGNLSATIDYNTAYYVTAPDNRVWKIVYDASINPQRKSGRQIVSAGYDYKVELVSPILTYYEDIKTVQELVRKLRKAGGITNKSTGIHVHLDGANHTPRSIRNFINIIASKNDLLYKALQIAPERMHHCKKIDAELVEIMNRRKPTTLSQIESIWYYGYQGRSSIHYHDSRYHFLYG